MTSAPRFPVPLSVLDRSLTRKGEHPGQALRETVRFAQQAEELGFLRFWVSEHHAVPGIAGSAPTVLAAAVASATSRIRVGTGGVMLPNHQPLVVAEQFGVLESLFPGRIDMGLGRSVGFTDGIRKALRVGKDAADGFSEQISELLGYFDGTGLVRARPAEGLRVPPFVLAVGSGATVAAEHGLPLVIGASRDERRTLEAVKTYRAAFRPRPYGVAYDGDARSGASPHGPVPHGTSPHGRARYETAPYVVIAVNAAAADTPEEAELLQLPEAWSTALSRTHGTFAPLVAPEEVLGRTMSPKERAAFDEARQSQLRGTEAEMIDALTGLVERAGADEVLLTLNTYDPDDRLRSYRRLADAAGLAQGIRPEPSAAG
ncbi:MsnO8 family LLM class oxidoreductase [Streptomyces smyrnaeus]|uniref:MsnO8 family LLM class oxidoreductase n=1 Tax=Streptomyces TaxID=1883 RepID=UPI000C192B27|nr:MULTISPECIES: MsnO8 family LLM class oxidoreductase [unclassified Streptomyces]MBQ0868522.1 MsnO8 family LLM class oxidoreductase [Streptomyces sp. RK75]MBQ1120944.1 MsnO8 family LLM class oxidoreductase [Streptomyces sp. B15]MBQ1162966.1 MsnO8 family LLM class oxidoreductase [Streptomyces sp. A73]